MAGDDDRAADVAMMRRAIDLAMRGRGAVEPNPMVGCVLTRGGRVIGEGYHQRFGGPHAERQALLACAEDPAGATAYVTLEPCCDLGPAKKTPPCVPALLAARLARVVVGCADPNPGVSGRGIEQLRAAGLRVDVGILEPAARQLVAPFELHVRRRVPYVTLKWAQSADGLVAGAGGRPVRITNDRSTRVVHELRSRCDAIVVGVNTVLSDDPLLTVRGVAGGRVPARVVLDRQLRTPPTSRLARTARDVPLTILCSVAGAGNAEAMSRSAELERLGARVRRLSSLDRWSTDAGLNDLTHALVEPGPTLARAFLDAGLADRVWVFRSPRAIGEPGAPRAIPLDGYPLVPTGSLDLDGDVLTEYLNTASPAFHAPEPSADLLLAGALR